MFDHVNVAAASVFIFFFALVTVLGFVAARWKAGDLEPYSRMGPRRQTIRSHGSHGFCSEATLHRVYGDCGSGGRLRDRRLRIFRRALHDHRLSVSLFDAA